MKEIFPVDAFASRIEEFIKDSTLQTLILRAQPGAGKSTRIPQKLISYTRGKVYILEPRRLAAQSAAAYASTLNDSSLGEQIGYQVRFENRSSENTKLLYLTEALLLRRLMSDPLLREVQVVILDEFHERSLHTDLAFMALKKLQKEQRSDLKLIIMSATLDLDAFKSHFLAETLLFLDIPGRQYPVEVEYLSGRDERSTISKLRAAVEKYQDKLRGDTLIFLPGIKEIMEAEKALSVWVNERGESLFKLYGEMSLEEQRDVFRETPQKKWILSTNIAETSLTLPRVASVIDLGLQRVLEYSPWLNSSVRKTISCSQSSCEQRKGRAGRVQEGYCLRLFLSQEWSSRIHFSKAEIEKSELSWMLLMLLKLYPGMNEKEVLDLPWFEVPPLSQLGKAWNELRELELVDSQNKLTTMGLEASLLPLTLRLSSFFLKSKAVGLGAAAAALVVLINENVRLERLKKVTKNDSVLCDFFPYLQQVEKDFRLKKMRGQLTQKVLGAELSHEQELRLCHLLFEAFSGRVAKKINSQQYLASSGVRAELLRESEMIGEKWLCILEGELLGSDRAPSLLMRRTSYVDPQWILKDSRLEAVEECFWDKEKEKVFQREAWRWGSLMVEETILPASYSEAAKKIFVEQLGRGWPRPFSDEQVQELNSFSWILEKFNMMEFFEKEFLQTKLAEQGFLDFSSLREMDLGKFLESLIDKKKWEEMRRQYPLRIANRIGQYFVVHYAAHASPWVELKIQDAFGLERLPQVGSENLTLHLLSPNRRPVQITQDLGSFWRNHYPQLKRELSIRYPRHFWPEDPLLALPPPPRHRKI